MLDTFSMFQRGELGLLALLFLLAMMVLVVAAIVFVERGQRRITVQYAKRVVGRRMYGGQSTHLPLRVNTSGVIPVIFASSIIAFPQTIASFFQANNPWMQSVADQLRWGMPLYNILYVTFIIFFCYFYTAIVFNPDDVAENMRKYGGFIPGIRPGQEDGRVPRPHPGADHVRRRHLPGPRGHPARVPDHRLPGGPHPRDRSAGSTCSSPTTGSAGSRRACTSTSTSAGTSLLIVVGVAMDTVAQVEAQLIMRHYEGFSGKGGKRIRGRR